MLMGKVRSLRMGRTSESSRVSTMLAKTRVSQLLMVTVGKKKARANKTMAVRMNGLNTRSV